MISQKAPHLFIHCFTHETIIGQLEDLPDYVPMMKQCYTEGYQSEYEDLGEINIGSDFIRMNPKVIVPRGSGVHMINNTIVVEFLDTRSFFQKLLDLFR